MNSSLHLKIMKGQFVNYKMSETKMSLNELFQVITWSPGRTQSPGDIEQFFSSSVRSDIQFSFPSGPK